MFMYSFVSPSILIIMYVLFPCILFQCVVLCTVCVQMCTVLLPPGVNLIAFNKYRGAD